MLDTLEKSAEAVRRAQALTGSPACFGRCRNGTRGLSRSMVAKTERAAVTETATPWNFFVAVDLVVGRAATTKAYGPQSQE
jgi:hypothetical protein